MEDKKKALFEALESAEKSLNKTPSSTIQSTTSFRDERRHNKRSERTDGYKHEKSIFKRPAIRRCFTTKRPAFELNPEKFIKYSLDDVDCSDVSNKRAAFEFLREIEQRKEKDAKEQDSEGSSEKIVFKRSAKLKEHESSEDEQKRYQGNKLVMKEYVVGEGKRKVKQKRKVETVSKSHTLKLSHLQHDDDDDDD